MILAGARHQNFEKQLDAYKALRLVWRTDPERYCRQRLSLKPTWQQRQALAAITEPGARVSVRSGHSTGKDAIAAGIILWFLETMEYPRVPCTAPTSHQLYDVLWGELAKWMRRADEISMARGDHPRFWLRNLFKLTQDMLYDYAAPKEIYAVARTARKDSPEGLQGFHSSDIELDDEGEVISMNANTALLLVIDEASGVPDAIYEVLEGALATPGCRMMEIGNATRNTGAFAAHHKAQRNEYTTLHWRSDQSPLCDTEFRPRLVRKFGEDSNMVRVRADGEFPKADDDTLIPFEWAEAASHRQVDRDPVGKKRLGIDVARYGSDRTVFLFRHDYVISYIEIHTKQGTMETAGKALLCAQDLQVDEIDVDIIGVGSGVYDRLVEIMRERKQAHQWWCEIVPVNVAEAAPERQSDREAQAYKMRDFLWLEMRAWLQNDAPAFVADDSDACNDLVGELTAPTFRIDSSGRIVVESKDDLKKRTNGQSPDLADALGCTFVPPPKPTLIIAPPDMHQASRWRP